MTDKILCKYYASGCCQFGDKCHFSHDFGKAQNMVCTYYLRGNCAYGDKCRYDHVKPDWFQKNDQETKQVLHVPPPPRPSHLIEEPAGNASTSYGRNWASIATGEECDAIEGRYEEAAHEVNVDELTDAFDYFVIDDNPNEFDLWRRPEPPSKEELGICMEYCETGYCSNSEDCTHVHGDFCETCEKYCLDPNNQESREVHSVACRAMHDRLQAIIRSGEMECGICLEKVLSKPNFSDRRFGLMACEHIFCLKCIRNWRSTADGDVDVQSALRTCPICRTTTHFVTPSSIFPAHEEEKDAIVNGYKAQMAEIDCMHFNFGEGQCPFANSCFYRHVYRDGRKADITLRTVSNADGEFSVVREKYQLGDLFNTPAGRRITGRRRR